MPRTRLTMLTAGLAAAALAMPGAAAAQDLTAPLPSDRATVLQQQLKASGHYPAPPALGSVDAAAVHDHEVRSARRGSKIRKPKGAKRVRVETASAAAKRGGSGVARASVFGSEGAFDTKRMKVMGYIAYYFSSLVPKAGGTYRAPAMYEFTDSSGNLPGCIGGMGNGAYCSRSNTVGWLRSWALGLWTRSGDNAWATPMAHEFGHGAQRWLGFEERGQFQHTLYREGFADCMAGAWYQWMHSSGFADTIGRGDGNEFFDFFKGGSNETRSLGNHGDFSWRYGAAIYGWNTGFLGCKNWGGTISLGRAA
jgi:hypothetical protein